MSLKRTASNTSPCFGRLVLASAALAVAVVLHAQATPLAGTGNDHKALITIDPPGSIDTRPFGITPQGTIVGQYFTSDGLSHGFLLRRGNYTRIDVPGAIRTNALAINVLGQIVGRYDTPDGRAHGYLLSGGAFTTVDFPGAAGFTTMTDINPSGQMVGRYRGTDGRFHGFSLDGIFEDSSLVDGTFTTIDYPGAISIQGMALNAAGTVAGYYVDMTGRFHGFLLDGDSFSSFDPPDSVKTGESGGILKINPAGDVVGIYTTASDVPLPCGCSGHGFIFRNGTFTSFDFPNAVVTNNTGINPQGDIVGNYIDQAGRRHGFSAPAGAEDEN
jgi:hypothetical protein